ncbi:MAG TPA: DUF488 domain-containing protein [Patescibacteria group bacterium]|nr:DUF488 domain-containing protein [Patescibacteria group bacterium]
MKNVLYTIGHSTRSSKEFLTLLHAHGIRQVIDIRTIPRSRHNPQFNKEKISIFLRRHGINYSHEKHLGGLRHAKKDSPNTGWKNRSFRGFADYMLTEEFELGLKRLMRKAKKKPTVIMCAEAVPWRCHRSLVADALIKRKWRVFHIQSRKTAKKHKLTPFLRIRSGKFIYR